MLEMVVLMISYSAVGITPFTKRHINTHILMHVYIEGGSIKFNETYGPILMTSTICGFMPAEQCSAIIKWMLIASAVYIAGDHFVSTATTALLKVSCWMLLPHQG